jgi:hypothetical protein
MTPRPHGPPTGEFVDSEDTAQHQTSGSVNQTLGQSSKPRRESGAVLVLWGVLR